MSNKVYLNNQFVDEQEAKIAITDRGFLLGDGIFETLLIFYGNVVFWADHWERLCHGLAVLDIPNNLNESALKNIIDALITKNQLTNSLACVRLTITRGDSERGLAPPLHLKPTLLITATSWQDIPSAEYHLIYSNIVRNEQSLLSTIKSINYLDNILAKQQAVKQNAGDAILLNTKGHIAETSCANLFMVKENCVYTPPIIDGALPGIIRKKIIEICLKNNINIIEKSLLTIDLIEADEIFLTNSLILIKSVTHLENATFKNNYASKLKNYLLNNLSTNSAKSR